MVKLRKICLEIKILLRLASNLPKKPIFGRISDFWPCLSIHYPCPKSIQDSGFLMFSSLTRKILVCRGETIGNCHFRAFFTFKRNPIRRLKLASTLVRTFLISSWGLWIFLKTFGLALLFFPLKSIYVFWEGHKILLNLHLTFDCMYQEFRREGWTEKHSAVCFCLGSGLFGSYNSD